MSLRARIVTLIGAVMFVSVLLGATLAGLEARRALAAELDAALAGGRQTVLTAFEDLPRSDHPQRDLDQLIATFNGNRHVAASLIDPQGGVRVRSTTVAPGRPAPGWFARLLASAPPPLEIPAPSPGAEGMRVRLQANPAPDIGVIWLEASWPLSLLLGSAVIGLFLVFLAIGAALRPLSALPTAFARIGEGDYGPQVPEAGPPEVARLQRAFNQMTGQLAAMRQRNLALENQLLTIQDEERADIARDLHDDMGPHLFAVKVDAQMIAGRPASQADPEVARRLSSIQATVGHMQKLVRDLISRLRPTAATELGLQPAVRDLVAFWQANRPGVAVEVRLADEAGFDDALKDTVFRVIQEALHNAMRHAEATQVRVRVERLAGEVLVEVANDGRPKTPANGERGFGLVGLRERVVSSGGELEIDRGDEGGEKGGNAGGWTVRARLPVRGARPATDAAA